MEVAMQSIQVKQQERLGFDQLILFNRDTRSTKRPSLWNLWPVVHIRGQSQGALAGVRKR